MLEKNTAGRTRTGTPLKATDFKSAVSTISPRRHCFFVEARELKLLFYDSSSKVRRDLIHLLKRMG